MIRNTILVFACGGVVALVACSSDAGDKYPDANSFCAAKADAECQNIAPGCNATVDACKPLRTSACTSAGAQSGRTYTASLAQACIDKVNAVYSKKTFTADDEQGVLDACARVFAGSVAKNGACQVDYDCQSSLVCSNSICADRVAKNQGDPCADPGDVCGGGTFCGSMGGNKICLPANTQGASCSTQAPCASSLRCAVMTGSLTGTCQALLAPNDPCAADSDCSPSTTPPYCDPTQKKCLPKFGLGTQSCKDFGAN